MEQKFRDWLIERGNPGAATNYPRAIHLISEHYSKETGTNTDIYLITDQLMIREIAHDYSQAGRFSKFGYEQHSRFRAAIARYLEFFVQHATVKSGSKSVGPNMTMPMQSVAVPLFDDGHGGLRVTGTRVLLERIVHAFEDGATPEGIVQSYDTLQLADVYAVLSWYLRHKLEVERYLRERAEEAEAVRRTIEAKQPDRAELRARLMARQAQKEVVHAPPGQ